MPTAASSLALPPLPTRKVQPVPEHINPDAVIAFDEMIAACGNTVYRMPTSCEMYIRQFMTDFPKERDLLTKALKFGVPDRIMMICEQKDYISALDRLTREFVKATQSDPNEGKWAVHVWATGIGKPTEAADVVLDLVELTVAPTVQVSDKSLRLIMAFIAGAGGLLGGAFATGLGFLIVYLMFVPDSPRPVNPKVAAQAKVAVVIVALMCMAMTGMAGGIAGFAGWLFGRGNEHPWTGFAVAFGSAFGTGILGFFIRGPGIVTSIAVIITTFGATTRIASRGGYEQS